MKTFAFSSVFIPLLWFITMKKQRPKIPLLPYILFSLFSDSCSTCIISIPRVLSRYLSTCTVYSTMNTYRLVAQSITMQGTLEFEGEDVPSTTSWILPSAQLQVTIILSQFLLKLWLSFDIIWKMVFICAICILQGQWESLVFDTGIKEELIQFVETVLYLSDRGVDQNIMGVNRVILLHGPPGTTVTQILDKISRDKNQVVFVQCKF